MNLDVSAQYEGDQVVIHIEGELDAHGAIQLDRVIQHALAENVFKIMVNCIHLKYISSAGMGVFISHMQELESSGGRFVFFGQQASVRTAFELLGLEKVFAVVETEDDARLTLQ
jgi:anti-sigma B factor antagonist